MRNEKKNKTKNRIIYEKKKASCLNRKSENKTKSISHSNSDLTHHIFGVVFVI